MMASNSKMIKGVTKTGFAFSISQEALNDYELIEMLSELDENVLVLTKIVNRLLGTEQAKLLKDHIRNEDGVVKLELMSAEIEDIFSSSGEDAKNS